MQPMNFLVFIADNKNYYVPRHVFLQSTVLAAQLMSSN